MTSPRVGRRDGGRLGISRAADRAVAATIAFAGWTAIIVLAAIFAFLVLNSFRAFQSVSFLSMLTGSDWFPTSAKPRFGFLPSITGSLWVTGIAILLAMPIGVAAAVFISEFATGRFKDIVKSLVEFMAAVPSVVLGLIGISLLAPKIQSVFHLESGLTALTAGLVVGVMTLPTVISIAEDAMHAVPDELRMGSAALGNTSWQTTYKVVVPSASSGIFAAVMLGLGRAIGETMVVLMLAGNSGLLITSPFLPARTLTGTIAQEMGEVVQGGLHYSVLFAMGLTLFIVTFLINLAADVVLDKQRKRWRR
jgi:phosphate transport system permease protein